MTDLEWGWVIGILEGEGSFTICQYGTSQYRHPKVSAQSTDRDIVFNLRRLLGGHVNGPYTAKKKWNSKIFWDWTLGTDTEVIALMKKLYPHMTPRRQDTIQKIIQEYETQYVTKPSKRYTPETNAKISETLKKYFAEKRRLAALDDGKEE